MYTHIHHIYIHIYDVLAKFMPADMLQSINGAAYTYIYIYVNFMYTHTHTHTHSLTHEHTHKHTHTTKITTYIYINIYARVMFKRALVEP